MSEESSGLTLMRKKFDSRHISKLPKPTKQQTEQVKADFKKGIRCKLCGAWHHPDVVHLDYVGHAALTDRLLDADINWTWEPMAYTDAGIPLFDNSGGMWIKLTVCGMTRIGYGNADDKARMDAGAREKEVIGDALRNAAMRFGAALDLWHKGDLHAEGSGDSDNKAEGGLSAYQISEITDALADAQYPLENFLTRAGAEKLEDIDASRYEGIMAHISGVAERGNGSA